MPFIMGMEKWSTISPAAVSSACSMASLPSSGLLHNGTNRRGHEAANGPSRYTTVVGDEGHTFVFHDSDLE